MKKNKSIKIISSKKISIFIGIVVFLSITALTLVNNFYYQIFTPASINKIQEEDPSLAKTATEKKIIEKVNSAAQKESRFKVDSAAHQEAVKDLYVAGTMLDVVRTTNKNETNLKTIEEIAISKLKASNALPNQGAVLDENGKLRAEANLPISQSGGAYTGKPKLDPSDPNSPYFDNSQSEECKNNPTAFGCAYPPDFVYTGDEKCGGSVAGYYCWGSEEAGYKYYVINLPATMAEHNKKLTALGELLDGNHNDELRAKLAALGLSNDPKGLEKLINSYGIYDSATVAKYKETLKSNNIDISESDAGSDAVATEKQRYESLKSAYESDGGILKAMSAKNLTQQQKDDLQFYNQYEKDNEIGFFSKAEQNRVGALAKKAEDLLSGAVKIAPTTLNGKTATITQSYDGGRKFTTYTFGDGKITDTYIPTSGNKDNKTISTTYTDKDIEEAKEAATTPESPNSATPGKGGTEMSAGDLAIQDEYYQSSDYDKNQVEPKWWTSLKKLFTTSPTNQPSGSEEAMSAGDLAIQDEYY